MKGKKTFLIGGGLLSPLEIGVGALIQTFNGDYFQTTPVQTIFQENIKQIKFETQDSIYHVLSHVAPAVRMPVALPMCA